MDGEIASDELQESAIVVWDACQDFAPTMEEMQGQESLHSLQNLSRRLKSNFGIVKEDALEENVASYYHLRELLETDEKHDIEESTNPDVALLNKEFGSDFDFKDSKSYVDSTTAIMQICGISASQRKYFLFLFLPFSISEGKLGSFQAQRRSTRSCHD